jgi:hypothetical protein
LAWHIRGLRGTLDEHLVDNDGEVLPHPLMSEYERWAEAAWQSGDPELRPFLDLLEDAYATGDAEIEELISVSFLEHLPRIGHRGSDIRELLGPTLQKQLAAIG